ncbi:MAG: hypothetical protein BGO77_00210 [Caedibacter sp. 37-49]|nr:MAG: hypothetical protein BGO77_00210 [Caedibacter sp. 37-49]
MQIFWTISAKNDLESMFEYITQENLPATYKIYEEIQSKIEILSDFPYAGKIGRIHNTRELVFSELSYTAIYRLHKGNIQILRLFHGAQHYSP